MKVRIVIEYDPDWNPGDITLQLITEVSHWETGHVTINDVRAVGGSVTFELIET
jgi:hypothetical protein